MPNHVTNVLTVECDNVELLEEIKSSIVNEDGHMDFDKIVPEPEEYVDFEPHHGIVTRVAAEVGAGLSSNPMLAMLESANREREMQSDIKEEDKADVEHARMLYKKYGFSYWRDWRTFHWGTKWGAYDGTTFDGNTIEFDTAWSMPNALYTKLSQKYPDATFVVKYADEDIGNNCGIVRYVNGELDIIDMPPVERTIDDERKWRKFAIELRNPDANLEDYGLDENYDYLEE